jgi:hypothetical protein
MFSLQVGRMQIRAPDTSATGTLANYGEWWFSTRCRCRHNYLPVRMLLADLRPSRPVAEVARLLRCKSQCGERPHHVELVPDARCDHKGVPLRVPGKPPLLLIGDCSGAAAPDGAARTAPVT